MPQIVLVRHGESLWNRENRFTGWTDVELTPKGTEEAHAAGRLLREEGFVFDLAYTSVLRRAIRTLWIVLDEMDLMWIPIAPVVRAGKRVLIAAHGNSLRALVKYLDGISDADIISLNIPTGIPLMYELDADLKPISSRYLGDPEAVKRAAEAVANQGKAGK